MFFGIHILPRVQPRKVTWNARETMVRERQEESENKMGAVNQAIQGNYSSILQDWPHSCHCLLCSTGKLLTQSPRERKSPCALFVPVSISHRQGKKGQGIIDFGEIVHLTIKKLTVCINPNPSGRFFYSLWGNSGSKSNWDKTCRGGSGQEKRKATTLLISTFYIRGGCRETNNP